MANATIPVIQINEGNVGIGTTSPTDKLYIKGDNPNIVLYSDTLTGSLINFIDQTYQSQIMGSQGTLVFNTGGTSERMRITSAGNVGIGAASPSAKLVVQGTAGGLYIDDLGAGYNYYDASEVHNFRNSAGSSRLYINASSGNVGIGTTSPGYKLDVNGSVNIASGQPLRWGSGDVEIINSGHNLVFKTYDGVDSLDEHMRITSAGNVGIGTTSPEQKLHVNGRVQVNVAADNVWMDLINSDESAFRLRTYNNGTSEGNSVYAFKHGLYYNGTENAAVTFYRGGSSTGGFLTFTTDNGTERMRIDSTGNVGIGTTSPFYKLDVTGDIRSTFNVRANANVIAGGYIDVTGIINHRDDIRVLNKLATNWITWATRDTSGSETVINLSNVKDAVFSGNVGIGTTSPAVPLDVSGIIRTSTSFVGNAVIINQVTAATSGGRILFKNNSGSDKMAMEDNGNFGIGTTSPSQKLQVEGNSWIKGIYYDTSGDAGANGQVLSSTATGTNWIDGSAIPGVPGGSGTLNTVAMWTPDGDTLGDSPITISGNNATFAGSIYAASTIGNLTGGSLGQQMEKGNESVTTLRFDADAWRVYAGGSGSSGEALRVTETGNVGIGQTNPGAKLQVTNGNFLVNGSGVRQINVESSDSEVRIGLKGNNGNQFRFISDGTHFKLNDTSKERIKITNAGDITLGGRGSGGNQATWMTLEDQTGNVGIGTTSPAEKLQVDGNIQINDHDGTGNLQIGASDGAGNDAIIGMAARNSSNGISPKVELKTIYDSSGGANGSAFTISTRSGSGLAEKMRITSGGNVGIGTTDPQDILVVANSVGETRFGGSNGRTLSARHSNGNLANFDFLAVQTYFNSDFLIAGGKKISTANGVTDNLYLTTTDASKAIYTDRKIAIGTTSPSQKLHVVGNARVTGAYYDSNNSAGTSGQVLSSTATGTDWIDGSAIPGVPDGSGTANYTARWIDTDTLGTGVLYDNGSNVGISATSLSSKLHIGDSSNGNNNLLTMESSGAVWVHLKTPPNTQSQIGFGTSQYVTQNTRGRIVYNSSTTTANNYMSFVTNFAEVMRITNSNVGIGTTSPGAKLQINNAATVGSTSANLSGLNPILYLDAGQAAGRSIVLKNHSSGDNTVVGALKFAASPDAANYSHASIEAKQDANGTVDTLEFRTSSSNTQGAANNLAMIIEGTNVGIGTASPSEKLEVVGNIISTFTTVGTPALITSEYSSSNVAELESNMSGGKVVGTSEGGEFVISSYSDSYINYGNVGIGTTSPNYMLHLGGATVGAVNGQLAFGDVANVPSGLIQGYRVDGSYKGELRFSTSTSGGTVTQRMVIDEDGNVGIGTTSPAEKLAVSGSIRIPRTEEFYWTDGSIDGNARAVIFSTNNEFGGDYNGIGFSIGANGRTAPSMYIRGTGNVGIGTTSPSNKLDVNGIIEADKLILPTAGTNGAGTVTTPAGKLDIRSDSTWSNSAIIARTTTNQNPVLAFYRPSGSAALSYPWWLEANGSTFQIKTGTTANIGSESVSAKVTISSGGGVSINSTNAFGYYLYVNGSAAKNTGTTWVNTSDERTKENIQNYTKGLNDIVKLQPRVFDYNGKGSTEKSKENIGLIAQEVINVYPEAIGTFKGKLSETDAEETDIYNLDFHSISISMINAIKELNEKVKILEDKIQTLENQ